MSPTHSPSTVVRYAVFAVFASMLAAGSTARADVISGSSLAFGASVSLTGALTITSAPAPVASGTAPPPYAATNSALSASVSPVLSTGLLTVNASSNVDGAAGARFAAADATVDDLLATLLALLSLSATSVESTALVSGDFGALVATGTTTLEGAVLVVGGVAVAVDASPAANTHAFTGGGLDIILNEQIVGGDGIGTRSIEVNAIHIAFDDFLIVGVGLLDGDIIISHSEAALVAVPGQQAPEPTTLLLLAAGILGLAWFARRKNG